MDARASIDIPICISICEIQAAMQRDSNLQKPKKYITEGWDMSNEINQEWRPYRIFRKDGVTLKNRKIIILTELQKQAPDQFHINNMGIERTRLLARNLCTGQCEQHRRATKKYYVPWN